MIDSIAIPQPAATRSRTKPATADIALAALALLAIAAAVSDLLTVTAAGAALAGLSLLVTLVVMAFARRQLRADPRSGTFARLAAGLALATVMMALAADVLLLVAAWIVSGRMMAGLVGHVGDWGEARVAARRANLAFTTGDLALIAAAVLLALGAGSTDVARIGATAGTMDENLVLGAALLLVIAAIARCAAPPFSGWLLGSLAAPTPVSALMHAGFVNAGGYLLVRFAPVIEAVPVVRYALFAAGTIAAVAGTAIMLARSDVKGSLAASTVAQMGFMLITVALGAYAAALWHMAAHGMFKAWLFLGSAGTVAALRAPAKGLDQPIPALIALATLTGAFTMLDAAIGDALLPLGLATAALLAALAVGIRNLGRGRFGILMGVLPIVLIVVNVAALAGMAAVQPGAAIPLLSPHSQFAVLSLFLGGWVWQQSVMTGDQVLPPSLHARLLHAGANFVPAPSAPAPFATADQKD